MAEVFELKLQLAEERGSRLGVAGGEPWTAGSRGDPRSPIERAVQSGTVDGGDRISNLGGTAIGLDGRMHIEPMPWMGNESAPSPARWRVSTSSRNGDSGAVPVQSENAAGWRALVVTYNASTLGAKVQCLQSLTSIRVKPGANPSPSLRQ